MGIYLVEEELKYVSYVGIDKVVEERLGLGGERSVSK